MSNTELIGCVQHDCAKCKAVQDEVYLRNGDVLRLMKERDALQAQLAAAQGQLAIPVDVKEVAEKMQKNGYRGPMSWIENIIDFVADYAAPIPQQPAPSLAFAIHAEVMKALDTAQPEPAYVRVGEDGEGQENYCPDCGAEPGQMCSSVEGVEWGRRVHVARQQAQPELNKCQAIAYSQFLTDVTTAAGLLKYGKQCKDLAERIADYAFTARWAGQPSDFFNQLALQKLGARLAELLDEDQWAECEALLIEAGARQ